MINWGEIYCLGIENIDNEHKVFFEIAENATKLVNVRDAVKDEDIQKIIEELQGFAKTHFPAEQRFMKEINYPDMEEHILEHYIFSAQITNIDMESISTNRKEYLLNAIDFMIEWIILHIGKHDNKIAEYYHNTYNKT